jgi:hypothetical protein
MLATSAEAIHEGLAVGDVYVHCKAGQGRSAQAILAYLMKYDHETPDDAIAHMLRPAARIRIRCTPWPPSFFGGSECPRPSRTPSDPH